MNGLSNWRLSLLCMAALIGGCTTPADPGGDSAETAGADPGPDSESEEVDEDAPPLAPYSGGECPTFEEGRYSGFVSGGTERSGTIVLPDDPKGAPVLFVWHPLGMTGPSFLGYSGWEAAPEMEEAIIIAPTSCCGLFDWDFISPPESNVDLVYFDDLLTCLDQQFEIDRDRIWATGMSAGGLMTTALTLHRSPFLASVAPFSGGTTGLVPYSPPSTPIPALVAWGGETDIYAGFADFHQANVDFIEQLDGLGHTIVACDHQGGHVYPAESTGYAARFLRDHPRSLPSPYRSDGLPDIFPGYCALVP